MTASLLILSLTSTPIFLLFTESQTMMKKLCLTVMSKGQWLVIHGIYKELRLRAGQGVVGIYNDGYSGGGVRKRNRRERSRS